MEGILTMSHKEADRLKVISQFEKKLISVEQREQKCLGKVKGRYLDY